MLRLYVKAFKWDAQAQSEITVPGCLSMKLWGLTEPREPLASTLHLKSTKVCHMLFFSRFVGLSIFKAYCLQFFNELPVFIILLYSLFLNSTPPPDSPEESGLYFCQPKVETEVRDPAGFLCLAAALNLAILSTFNHCLLVPVTSSLSLSGTTSTCR